MTPVFPSVRAVPGTGKPSGLLTSGVLQPFLAGELPSIDLTLGDPKDIMMFLKEHHDAHHTDLTR